VKHHESWKIWNELKNVEYYFGKCKICKIKIKIKYEKNIFYKYNYSKLIENTR
jgi:hypothetical protein